MRYMVWPGSIWQHSNKELCSLLSWGDYSVMIFDDLSHRFILIRFEAHCFFISRCLGISYQTSGSPSYDWDQLQYSWSLLNVSYSFSKTDSELNKTKCVCQMSLRPLLGIRCWHTHISERSSFVLDICRWKCTFTLSVPYIATNNWELKNPKHYLSV